ncbi:MAG: DUF5916 domain-containing protein, partial [Gemmatimonadaceae bacterium]
YHDRRTAFHFGVNPAGVEWDAYLTGDAEWNADVGWDAVWESATTRDSSGWIAELRIPLSQLRFSAASAKPGAAASSGGAWGIQFIRWVARTGERSMWAYIPPGSNGFVSMFGELQGVGGIRPSRRFEVVPYSVARVTRGPGEGADPFYRPNEWYGTAGADVKYGLTSDLTLTATINPDFGQVEADPSEVNLTGSETFLSERRPFFVEGSDIFRFSFTTVGWQFGEEELFYSRRIGRAPQGDVPDEALYDSKPSATTMLGAMKVSGRTAGGWSVGLLDAVTQSEEVELIDGSGRRIAETVEPMTNYAMGRAIKDFNRGQTAVGAMVTATNRRLGGTGLEDELRGSAYVGGLNFRHRFGGGNFNLHGSVLGSHATGTAEAIAKTQRNSVHRLQRPDADHFEYDPTRTSLSGGSAHLAVGKNGGGYFRWGINGHVLTPGFEANDVGFHPNTDHFVSSGWVGLVILQPTRLAREWETWHNYWANWSLGGERRVIGGNLFTRVLLHNYWEVELELIRNGVGLSTNALRGGPAIYNPGHNSFWSRIATDTRKRLNLELVSSGMKEDETGGTRLELRPGIFVRPSGKMQVSLQPAVMWLDTPWQYVEQGDANGERHYILASLDQTTISATARVNYTFSPNLSLQVYAQPFISAGSYSAFKEVRAPRARTLRDRFRTFEPDETVRDAAAETVALDTDRNGSTDLAFEDPDFNERELITNTVLRWEYRPGSTLFVVWSHGRDEDGVSSFDLGRDARQLFRAEATNTLLVKFSYWMDL